MHAHANEFQGTTMHNTIMVVLRKPRLHGYPLHMYMQAVSWHDTPCCLPGPIRVAAAAAKKASAGGTAMSHSLYVWTPCVGVCDHTQSRDCDQVNTGRYVGRSAHCAEPPYMRVISSPVHQSISANAAMAAKASTCASTQTERAKYSSSRHSQTQCPRVDAWDNVHQP